MVKPPRIPKKKVLTAREVIQKGIDLKESRRRQQKDRRDKLKAKPRVS
jgi:hypothetical protein